VSTAAATSVSPPTAKEAKGTLPWRVDVTIIGNRRRDRRSNDCIVYPPYFPPHDVAARIKERCVDNAVGLDGQRRCQRARQLQVQSKVDVLGGPPATAAEAAMQAEHQLNLVTSRETDQMATRIDRQFLATSDPLVYMYSY